MPLEAEVNPLPVPAGSDAVTDEVLATLQDDSLRKQVYEVVIEQLDEVSMREIHYVLDALVSVLRGDTSV